MAESSPTPKTDRADRSAWRSLPGVWTCAVAAGLVLALGWFKLSSPDIGYHLAYGGYFLDHGKIVDRDPFLYPEHAVEFVNANWGSQVIMALVHRASGADGLIALRLALLAVVFACTALALKRVAKGTDPSALSAQHSALSLWIAWAWMLAALAGYERFSMRPELFSYAIMSIMVVILSRGIGSWRGVGAMALLQLLWVNLHSYFLVGIMLTACWLAGRFIRWPWFRRRDAALGTQHSAFSAEVRLLAVALLVQVAACFVNPWHVRGAVFPLMTLKFLQAGEVLGADGGEAGGSSWAEISEFHSPFSFGGQIVNGRTIQAYYMLLAVTAVGLLAAAIRGQIGPALAMLAMFAMSTQMRRNIAQFAFVASPLAIGAIAAYLQRFTRLASLAKPRRYLRAVLPAATILLAVWWIGGVWSGRFYYVERRITRAIGNGYNAFTFPRRAVLWLAQQEHLQPRLFVDYFVSSNALPWLPERFKLFVDTNTFAVKEETLRLAFDIGLGKAPHDKVFDEYGVNVVLLHCGPDTQTLVLSLARDDGVWALAYFDETAVVFVRRIPEHVPVILANPITPEQIAGVAHWSVGAGGGRYYEIMARGTAINVPMSLGWWQPASALARTIVDRSPDYFEAWNYLGVCHGNLGNAAARAGSLDQARAHWQEAARCFDEALRQAPGHKEARTYLEATRQRLDLLKKM